MRKQKPLPKESSFEEFAKNRASSMGRSRFKKDKKPAVSAKVRGMFEGKDSDKGSKRTSSRKTDSGRNNDRKTDSRRTDSRRDSGRNESRGRRPTNDKHDRRESRGNSFKENRRVDYKDSRNTVREFFDAVCANCGKPCKVPFKPTTGKPISCSDCFEAGGHKSGDRRPQPAGRGKGSSWESIPASLRGKERRSRQENLGDRRQFGESSQRFASTNSGIKELFDAVCMKCGNKCKVPFKPINGKGVSCSNCFDKNKAPGRDRKKSGDKRSGSKKTYAQKINDGNKKAFAGRGQKSSRARSSRSKEDKPLSASRGGKSSGRSDGRSFNGRK